MATYKFDKLEAMRGVAACMVLGFHSPFSFGRDSLPVFAGSHLFVDFFFVLSGFVMSYAYGATIRGGIGFARYLALRLARIYPLHLLTLLLLVPYVLLKHALYLRGHAGSDPYELNNVTTFIQNLLLVHGLGLKGFLSWNIPSWTISTEFFAYIAFFWLTLTLDRRGGLLVPVLICAAAYAVRAAGQAHHADQVQVFGCLGAFYLGVLVYRLRPRLERIPLWRAAGMVEAAVMLGILATVSAAAARPGLLGLALVLFTVAVWVFGSEHSGPVGRLLQSRGLRAVGVWSYSIYLLHYPVFLAAASVASLLKVDLDAGLGWRALPVNLALFAFIVALSALSFRFVEQPARDGIKRLLERRRAAVAAGRLS